MLKGHHAVGKVVGQWNQWTRNSHGSKEDINLDDFAIQFALTSFWIRNIFICVLFIFPFEVSRNRRIGSWSFKLLFWLVQDVVSFSASQGMGLQGLKELLSDVSSLFLLKSSTISVCVCVWRVRKAKFGPEFQKSYEMDSVMLFVKYGIDLCSNETAELRFARKTITSLK